MSAFCRLPGKENQKGLLRKGSNAILLVFQETVCSANAAGCGAKVGARVGLYLLRTVVQVCQDIKSLKHGTHGIDDDEGPISLQDAITQPAQVAVRGGIMVQGAECDRGVPRDLLRLPPPFPSQPTFSLDIRGEKRQELDAVHAPCPLHVPEVRAGRGPKGNC